MPFEKGKSGNPNGRKKGSKNKATTEFKEKLNELLEHCAPKMLEWLESIEDPEKRFDILAKFAEYVHPKLARTETDTNVSGDININVNKRVYSAADND